MLGLSLSHFIILFVVVLLFGSRRLPELGSALGRGIHAFKKGLEGRDNNTTAKLEDEKAKSDTDSKA